MTLGCYGSLLGQTHECRALDHGSLSGIYTADYFHARAVGVTEFHRAFHIHMVTLAYKYECLDRKSVV